MTATADEAGFELGEHTADVVVAAWGATRDDCLRQAVLGLVASFADTRGAAATGRETVALEGRDEDRLVALLEEVVYLLDVHGAVPVQVEVTDGASRATLGTVALDEVRVVGAAPKAIAWSDLTIRADEHGKWRCHVIVDV